MSNVEVRKHLQFGDLVRQVQKRFGIHPSRGRRCLTPHEKNSAKHQSQFIQDELFTFKPHSFPRHLILGSALRVPTVKYSQPQIFSSPTYWARSSPDRPNSRWLNSPITLPGRRVGMLWIRPVTLICRLDCSALSPQDSKVTPSRHLCHNLFPWKWIIIHLVNHSGIIHVRYSSFSNFYKSSVNDLYVIKKNLGNRPKHEKSVTFQQVLSLSMIKCDSAVIYCCSVAGVKLPDLEIYSTTNRLREQRAWALLERKLQGIFRPRFHINNNRTEYIYNFLMSTP